MICDRCRRAVHPRRAEGWARVYARNLVGEDRYEVTELAWLCEACAEEHRAWLMGEDLRPAATGKPDQS